MVRVRFLIGAVALGGLVACASLVGLDASDPETNATTPDPGVKTDGGSGPVGDGTVTTEGGVTITPANVDFQKAVCGTQQSFKISIKNGTATANTYTVAIPPSEVFVLDGADATGMVKGDLPAHGVGTVTLKATSSKPGRVSADVTVTVGAETTTLNAALETLGAGLVFDPPTVSFSAIRENVASADSIVTLRNDGNDPITIQAFTNAPDFATPKDIMLAAGASITQSFKMTPGTAGSVLTQQAVPVVQGEHCGPIPTITLSGQRVNTNVTVSPGQLELGSPPCNGSTVGIKQTITLSNYSTLGPATFTVKPPTGSRFTYSALTGNIPQAPNATTPGVATVDVGIASIGNTPQDVTEALTVSTVGDVSKDWPIKTHFKVVGAVVTLGKTSVDLRNNTYTEVPITNTGNVTVCVDYTSDNSQIDIYEGGNDHSDRLNAGDTSQRLSVAFFNGSSTNNTGKVTIKPYACPGSSTIPAVCNTIPQLTVNGKP